jgi:hypothetical protein
MFINSTSGLILDILKHPCILCHRVLYFKLYTKDIKYVRLLYLFNRILGWAENVRMSKYLFDCTVLWAGLRRTYCAERLSPVASSLFKEPDNTDIRSGGGGGASGIQYTRAAQVHCSHNVHRLRAL